MSDSLEALFEEALKNRDVRIARDINNFIGRLGDIFFDLEDENDWSLMEMSDVTEIELERLENIFHDYHGHGGDLTLFEICGITDYLGISLNISLCE